MSDVPNMTLLASRRPGENEWTKSYHGDMIATVTGEDVLTILEGQMYWLCELASHLPTVTIDVVHKPYGWTIRQVFEHGVDCERFFGYRMLRLAAGDKTPIPGFDENAYADARFGLGNFSNLVSEWGDCRKANLHLLRRISPNCWDHQADIDGDPISLRAVAWVCAAHLQHHLAIVEQRIHRRVDRGPLLENIERATGKGMDDDSMDDPNNGRDDSNGIDDPSNGKPEPDGKST